MLVQCTLAVAEVGSSGEGPWGLVEKEVGSGGRKWRTKWGKGENGEEKRGKGEEDWSGNKRFIGRRCERRPLV